MVQDELKRTQPKDPRAFEKIRNYAKSSKIRYSVHAEERLDEREIIKPEVLYVLKNSGFHEERKDLFDHKLKSWGYAIRGRTIDGRSLRVCVSLCSDDSGIVVTVIDLDKKEER